VTVFSRISAITLCALFICPADCVFATDLTGDEKVVASVMVMVSRNLGGKFVGRPSVRAESATLRECYEQQRVVMNEFYRTAMADKNSDGTPMLESISVTCVYEVGGFGRTTLLAFGPPKADTSQSRFIPKCAFLNGVDDRMAD
jgi:hypothetical protein